MSSNYEILKAKKAQGRQDYKKMAISMPFDFDPKNLPIIKLNYADVLSRPLFYPDNKFAYGLCVLMRRKSFKKEEIEHLRDMGFTVEVKARKIEIPNVY